MVRFELAPERCCFFKGNDSFFNNPKYKQNTGVMIQIPCAAIKVFVNCQSRTRNDDLIALSTYVIDIEIWIFLERHRPRFIFGIFSFVTIALKNS